MKKSLLQLLVILLLFFGLWAALSTIPFVEKFKISEKTEVNETKLGDLIWGTIQETETIVKEKALNDTLRALKNRICKANNLPADSFRLYIIESSEVNAFALPNHRLVIYTGLIEKCNNAEELCAVMAHEMAHIEKKHVMKKLLKEAGIALISAITGAGGNNEIIREVIKMLSSSAYDRSLEDEADQTGADFLCKTGIDPIHMANFFLRLSEKDDLPEMLDWISTHKDSKERAAAILQLRKKINCTYHFTFTAEAWESVQQAAQ